MTTGIDKAIKELQAQIIEDAYDNGGYAGSKATENAAYEAVCQRLEDALSVMPEEHRAIVQALQNGVLADIQWAGQQVRENYL